MAVTGLSQPFVRAEHDALRVALVSPPVRAYESFEPAAHGLLDRCDWTRAAKEHQDLGAALGEARVRVETLPGDVQHPEHLAPTISALVTSEGVLVGRTGIEPKAGRERKVEERLHALGMPVQGRVSEPGTFHGALDAIVLERYAFIGKSARSNENGRNQVARAFSEIDHKVDVLPVEPYGRHLADLLAVLDEDTLLVHPRIAEEKTVRSFVLLKIPDDEPAGGSVLTLGHGRVLAHEGHRKTRRLMEEEGFDVLVADLTETLRTGFGPRHLVLALKRG